ncbi:MAG: LytTR family DNA-binding domain-containing protein [Flavobacteriales bacterium]|nr:LytTR family DNA-binding domain-containing protein [Flavobacteriales bacterium]
MKILITDDEPLVRDSIKSIVQSQYPDAIISEAGSYEEAVKFIENYPQVELLLLDIHLGEKTGFDVLKAIKIDQLKLKVIFITSFQDYAVKAFKFSAVDYIVKPVDPMELIEALGKAEKQIAKDDYENRLSNLIHNHEKEKKKIILNTQEKTHIVPVTDIIRCESDGNYTCFYLLNKEKILMSKKIKFYDEILTDFGFFRCHQSHLINLSYILHLDKKEGNYIRMSDDDLVPLANSKKDAFLSALSR